jgi:O-antigen ligase
MTITNFSQKVIFINLPSILTVLIPFFLITGPFLSDLAVSLVVILFILNSFKNNLVKYYKSYFFLYFSLFYLILIFSSLFSNYIFFSLQTSLTYLRFGIFSLSTWYLIEKNKFFLKYFFFVILFCFGSLILDGIFQYIFGQNILGFKSSNIYRISSFFNDELVMGSYLSRFTPLLIGLFLILNIKEKKIQIIFFLILSLVGILIFLSGERSSFFYYLITVLYLGIFLENKKIKFFFLVSLLLIVTLNFLKPNLKTRIFNETINQLNVKKYKTEGINYFSSVHTGHYITAIKIFLDNKIIGSGPKTFRKICKENKYYVNAYSCSTHPHHTYLQLLTETGIIGFLIITFIFFFFIFLSIKALFKKVFYKSIFLSDFQHCIIVCFFITLSPFTPSGNFFNNWLSIIYFIPVGFYLCYKKKIALKSFFK